jgi:hypothetical protein
MEKRIPTTIAYESSSFTNGDLKYSALTLSIVSSHFMADRFISWNTTASKKKYSQAVAEIVSAKGTGITNPYSIIDLLPEKCNLVLIINGTIKPEEVKVLDSKKQFNYIEIHFHGDEEKMNLSTAYPFLHTSFKIFINGEQKLSFDTTKKINYEKFMEDKEDILRMRWLKNETEVKQLITLHRESKINTLLFDQWIYLLIELSREKNRQYDFNILFDPESYYKEYFNTIPHIGKLWMAFTKMQKLEKKGDKEWKDEVRSTWQNYEYVDEKRYVFFDGPSKNYGPPIEVLYPEFADLTPRELYSLMKHVDPKKRNSQIKIPVLDLLKTFPGPNINYIYPLEKKIPTIIISPKTGRPLTHDENKIHWKIQANEYSPIEKQLNAYKYFINYVYRYKSFPNKKQFLVYMYDREKTRRDTLPENTHKIIDDVFDNYSTFTSMTPKEFITLVKASENIEQRVKME